MARGFLAYFGFGPSLKKPARVHAPPRPDEAGPPWAPYLLAVGEALSSGDAKGALRALQDADRCALATGKWEGMVEVGDAYLRVADASRARKMFVSHAHQNYLAALYCARQQSSIDGVLHTAARFASLGDRESTDQCLLIAEGMAETANDTGARDRVRRLAARMMSA
jgi:hypothetical protein